MNRKIVVVEDEKKIAELLRDYLLQNNFDVKLIHDGDEALIWLANHKADLVLLDLMLPGADGITICRETRKHSNIPIIMVTARVDEIDRLLGLEIGADDYICKPFSPREVIARVNAVLRRFNPETSTNKGFHLDQDACKVSYQHSELTLTILEFKLLQALCFRPGHILSRQQLMDRIYSDQRVVSDRTIDSHIMKLRHKLKSLLDDKEVIHAVYGIGYKFEISH